MADRSIDRRSFAKWAAVAGGAAALGSSLLNTVDAKAEEATAAPEGFVGNVANAFGEELPYGADRIAATMCSCGDVCGICHTANCFIKDGAIVHYEGNAINGYNDGKLCARGQSGFEIINSPDRIKYPMRRTNEKGVYGEWERISWDEAFDIITDAMVDAINTDGPASVAFGDGVAHVGSHGNWASSFAVRKLFNFVPFQGPTGCWNDLKFGLAPTLGDYYHTLDEDPHEADLVMFWGCNDCVAKPQEWADSWYKAKEKGAYFIDIESRISETSEKADLFIPVRPGCDSYVALAMANVIITEGLENKEFIEQHSIGYEEFKEVALRYTPELVEEIAWAPADRVRKAARMYAQTHKSIIEIGRGGNQTGGATSDSGWMMGRAVSCLIPLCGHVGEKGNGLSLEASTGISNGMFNHWNFAHTYRYPQSLVSPLIEAGNPTYRNTWECCNAYFNEHSAPLHVMVTNSNVAVSNGNHEDMGECLKSMDLVVMQNRIVSWTGSAYADILLPACSWAEMYMLRPDWEYSCATPPAIEPMYECMTDISQNREIALRLARKLNLGLTDEEVWPWADDRAMIECTTHNEKIIEFHKQCVEEGKEEHIPFCEPGMDYIEQHPEGIPNPYFSGQKDFVPYLAKYYTINGAPENEPESVWFPTEGGTGKALFRADFLAERSDGVLPVLPIPCEPQDSYYADGNPIESGNWELSDAVKAGYEFVSVGKAHTAWQFISFNQGMDGRPASALLREAFEDANTEQLRMNPVDAERLGLVDGDIVNVESQYGLMTDLEVKTTQTCMPRTIIPPCHFKSQNKIYPTSISLARVDRSLIGSIMPPSVGPFAVPGDEKRNGAGGQSNQNAVLCKVYKA